MSRSAYNKSYPEPDGRSGTHVPITLYSLWRSVPAIFIHGNMPNRHQEDKISLSRQNAPRVVLVWVRPNPWFSRPHLAASGHCLSLVHCLVGPDVGMSVPGLRWLVWSVKWVLLHVLCRSRCSATLSAYSSYFLLIPDLCS